MLLVIELALFAFFFEIGELLSKFGDQSGLTRGVAWQSKIQAMEDGVERQLLQQLHVALVHLETNDLQKARLHVFYEERVLLHQEQESDLFNIFTSLRRIIDLGEYLESV